MGITRVARVTICFIGVIHLFLSPPDPPSSYIPVHFHIVIMPTVQPTESLVVTVPF